MSLRLVYKYTCDCCGNANAFDSNELAVNNGWILISTKKKPIKHYCCKKCEEQAENK